MGETIIVGYIFFALTTALAAVVTILMPVLKELYEDQPSNPLLESTFLTYMVFILLSVVVAPLLAIPTIFDRPNQVFKDALLNSIKD